MVQPAENIIDSDPASGLFAEHKLADLLNTYVLDMFVTVTEKGATA
jgi:hypothetical protein